MMELDPEVVRTAAFQAAEILEGMGYTGRHGSIHLLDLQLRSNTVTAILHNMVAWQIAKMDKRWTFRPKGGATPDLTAENGEGVQIKATSNTHIKGNKVSTNEGFFVAVKYNRLGYEIKINEILMGRLKSSDWIRPKGTQWAILKPGSEERLRKIYP